MMNTRISGERILVTGGSGFIGRSIARKLAPSNNVVIVDKVDPHTDRITDIEYAIGNLADRATLAAVPGHFDRVFHFGSPSSIELFRPDSLDPATETVRGVINCMDFAIERGATVFVFPSSGTVYGNTIGDSNRVLRPVNIYGVLKLMHELYASTLSQRIRVVGLRIFMGYGPGEETKGAIASPAFLFIDDALHSRSPTIWGNGSQTRDLVYIDDIVDAAILSSHSTAPYTVLDVGTGLETSFVDMLDVIARTIGRDISPRFVPVPRDYQQRTFADGQALRLLLGRPPVSSAMGLAEFCRYLKSQTSARAATSPAVRSSDSKS
jgi:UDP-glucose 4-epimerase